MAYDSKYESSKREYESAKRKIRKGNNPGQMDDLIDCAIQAAESLVGSYAEVYNSKYKKDHKEKSDETKNLPENEKQSYTSQFVSGLKVPFVVIAVGFLSVLLWLLKVPFVAIAVGFLSVLLWLMESWRKFISKFEDPVLGIAILLLLGVITFFSIEVYNDIQEDYQPVVPKRFENVTRVFTVDDTTFKIMYQDGQSVKILRPPGRVHHIVADVPVGQPMYVDCQPMVDREHRYESFIHVHSYEDVEVQGFVKKEESENSH